MKRNSILTGLLTAAALTISTQSLAHGYYYTDYYDQTMHPATDRGVFVGLGVGYSVGHWDDFQGLTNINGYPFTINTSSEKIGYRGSLGYMFNPTWALEMGYAIFDNNDIAVADDVGPFQSRFNKSVKTNVIDLLLRVSIPLDHNFSLFTKIGAGYMTTQNVPDLTQAPALPAPNQFPSQSRTHMDVAYGVGMLYRIAPHWSTDLSWIHYAGNMKISGSYQPSIDYFSLGLAVIFPT